MSDSKYKDPYNRAGMWAFVFSIAFSLCFFFWVTFLHPGVDLKEVKEKVDVGGAALAKSAPETKSVDVSSVSDPWKSSQDMIGHGKEVYATNCAVCHGSEGLGDGPAGKAINARNLVEGKWKVGGDRVSLFKTVQGGLPGTAMAAFGHIPMVDRWAVVHYIQSITKNKQSVSDSKAEEFAKTAK